ncbi:MAG: hypothetical protein ABI855_02320 [Bacteroidota bacterium]
MMEINRNNYEIYFLDYHEVNLSAQQQAELFLFLEQHPDLKNEFESFDIVKLPSINISFEEKYRLKRELITKENYQPYLISNLEGDLNKEEKYELNEFLFQHPEYKKEEKLFSYTKLTPDYTVVFQDKSKLKHAVPIAEGRKKAFYFSVAAAACVLLMIGIYFLRQDNNEVMRANNETKKEISPVSKNNNSVENVSTDSSGENKMENVSPIIEKTYSEEKALIQNKSVLASNNNVEKKEKKSHQKKNHEEKTIVENKINTPESDELIFLAERKEISQIETKEIPPQQIAYINMSLLKQELNNSAALNSYLDKIMDPYSKNNSSDMPTSLSQNKQQQKPLLNFFAWTLSAFSKKDVTLKKSFNAEGNMVAYQLESGKFKIGKSSNR